MRRLHLLLLAGLLAGGLSAAAGAQAPDAANPARQCFFARNVRSWTEVDDRSVAIRVSGQNYLLQLGESCPELHSTRAVALKHRGGDWICTDQTFDLVVQNMSQTGPRNCLVSYMSPITPEAAQVLITKRR
jgi:hypothetical protein